MTSRTRTSSDLVHPERFSLPLLPAMLGCLVALNALCAIVTLSI